MDSIREKPRTGQQLQEQYGTIDNVVILGYNKYLFWLELKMDNGKVLEMLTGGDAYDIYRYNPSSRDWLEHLAAGIDWIMEKKSRGPA